MTAALADALIALLVSLVGILSGVIAWLVRKIWKVKTQDVSENTAEIRSLKEQMRGANGNDSGFMGDIKDSVENLETTVDHLQDTIEEQEETRKRRHLEVRLALKKVIEVLNENDMNGDLPEPDDLE